MNQPMHCATPEEKAAARDLSQAIWNFAKSHGANPTIGLLARSLIGMGFALDAETYEFADSMGTVTVTCTGIPEKQRN